MLKRIIFFISFLISCVAAFAVQNQYDQLMAQANKLYVDGNYAEAKDVYLNIATEKQGLELFYNLGNCCYRLDDIGHAILYYEKAHKIDPTDEDLNHNLSVAREKTVDKFANVSDGIVSAWTKSFVSALHSNTWAYLSILFFVISLVCLFVVFVDTEYLKKSILLGVSVLTMLLFVICLMSSVSAKNLYNSTDVAIITAQVCNAKSSPESTSNEVFVLHEGTKIEVTDKIGDFYEIRIQNGNKGWVPVSDIEFI